MPINPPAPQPSKQEATVKWASRNQMFVGFVIGQLSAVAAVVIAVLVEAMIR